MPRSCLWRPEGSVGAGRDHGFDAGGSGVEFNRQSAGLFSPFGLSLCQECLNRRLGRSQLIALADQIRKRLGELKVTLEDRPGGKTDWRAG